MRHPAQQTVRHTARHTLGSYRRLLGAALRSQLQYRASFSLDLLGTMLITVTEFGALALVFGRPRLPGRRDVRTMVEA